MANPKATKENKRSLMIHVRVSPSEKKIIKQKTKKANLRTLADYIRSKIV